jgi:hypothetical protein
MMKMGDGRYALNNVDNDAKVMKPEECQIKA